MNLKLQSGSDARASCACEPSKDSRCTAAVSGREVSALAPQPTPPIDPRFTDELVACLGRKPEALIPILHALQQRYGFLPAAALERLCQVSDITPAAVSGVATFYDLFRHAPAGQHLVRVCHGTACHVAGIERVEEALRRHLRIDPGADTDPDRRFTMQRVACLGCCTLAPVVRIAETTFGHASAERAPELIQSYLAQHAARGTPAVSTERVRPRPARLAAEIHVGLGSCCMAKGSDRLFHALRESAAACGVGVAVKRVGCVGMCHRTPLVEVAVPGRSSVFYSGLTPAQAYALVQTHFRHRRLGQRLRQLWRRILDGLLLEDGEPPVQRFVMNAREDGVQSFFAKQVHIATEHFGKIDPLDLDEYLAHDGFAGLARCLGIELGPPRLQATPAAQMAVPAENKIAPAVGPPTVRSDHRSVSAPLSAEEIIATIERSGLRGRGGAGFPTGTKWRLVRNQPGLPKFVICNGDEGDPGAFMDRMLLESFPYRIIEGMAIAAVAVGAHEGILYIRQEYPLAVRRVRTAITELEKRGWLGPALLGASGYPLKLSVFEGAGAFVCGEETALIASLEGRRGMPRLRPPYPAESGLWGQPTLINNVETFAVVPWIIRHGAAAFAAIGTGQSKGTKVFALAGRVRRGGLIEVPMGLPIREIVEEIGGGPLEGRRVKAVQIGGPSGGCVPARLTDIPVDYESLQTVGAIMGSGGLVVLDDAACMVDIARYFLRFTQEQSCGQCTFCRLGTKRMLDLLDRLCTGQATRAQLDELERLARQVSAASLCGLGKTAPNPVLTTLRYFRDEYEAHVEGHCPARKCTALIRYSITPACTGCTLCAQHCPVDAIPMTPYQRHNINQERCTKCDTCRQVCPYGAVEVK